MIDRRKKQITLSRIDRRKFYKSSDTFRYEQESDSAKKIVIRSWLHSIEKSYKRIGGGIVDLSD